MLLQVIRTCASDWATFGMLVQDNLPLCVTLELPWKDNQQRESCIPDGRYKCARIVSPKFGETFHIQDVPDRSEIIFHAGNLPRDTKGCILLGQGLLWIDGRPQIISSRDAMAGFRARMKDVNSFELLVIGGEG